MGPPLSKWAASRPVAEELYARLHAWFAEEIAAGVASEEFARCDPQAVADRTLALLDGFGVRTLIGDSTIPLQRARSSVRPALARDLGLGEHLGLPWQTTPEIQARTA